jgi:hypothetical protein
MKKKPKKILKIVLAAIILLVLVVILAIGIFADSAIKVGIETAGSTVLDVPVTLSNANLKILAGSVELNDLKVANPKGYQHDNMLVMGQGKVAVNIKSLLGDTVEIKYIKLDGINVVVEQKGLTSNIQDIIKSLPEKEPSKEEPQEPKQPDAKPGKKLHIDELEITNVKVQVKLLPIPGKADTLTLNLAPIKMENLGTGDDLDTAGLAKEIIVAIFEGIAKSGKGLLPEDMLNSLDQALGGLGQIGEDLLKQGGDILKGTGQNGKESIEDIGKGLEEGLKGIFGPKKKD